MEIQKFKDISTSVYNNIQALTPNDIQVLRDILRLRSVKYGRIRTFSLEDSQDVILLTLKQNCLILIKFLLEHEIELSEEMLDDVIGLLFMRKEETDDKPKSTGEAGPGGAAAPTFTTADSGPADPQGNASAVAQGRKKQDIDFYAQIEKERIEAQIFNCIIDIIYKTKYSNDKLKSFLSNKNVPDDASVNFAPIVDCEFKSFELIVLNKLVVGPVLLSLVQVYRKKLRNVVKNHIINGMVRLIDGKDYGIIYQIFYLINNQEHNDLLKSRRPENTPEYLAFVSSLIRNKEGAEIAYEKLLPFFDDLDYAFALLVGSSKLEERKIQPKDEQMIEHALECVNHLVKYRRINFYKFLAKFQAVLKLKISNKAKGLIYDILSQYVNDKDVYIEKILDCKEEIEQELKTKEYFLLPRVIRFVNAYQKREASELELVSQGRSPGSPYACNFKSSGGFDGSENASNLHAAPKPQDTANEMLDYKVLGLRSEDPYTVVECFDSLIAYEILKLNSLHIRNAMIKDSKVIDKVVAYQIMHSVVIEDISIVNIIVCTPNDNFFKYVRLFKDFSFYLNGDILERISDSLEAGLQWLSEAYNRELGLFVLKNCGYFNELLKANKWVQNSLLCIYDKILCENYETTEILIRGEDPACEAVDVFFVYDDDTEVSDVFFKIFTNQLLYAKFYKNADCGRFILKRKFTHPGFAFYLKAKIVAGFDVFADIKFMKANLVDTDELVGYLKIVSESASKIAELVPSTEKISPNILMNFGVKDSFYFLKNFPSSSALEKFILFFSLDSVNVEIDSLIKDEIMKCLKSANQVYLSMCVLQLFKCRDLDNILKILEKHFDNKELLLKLNIYNVINGGHYCSKALITQVSTPLMCKAIFTLYYLDVWDKDYLLELINKVDTDLSDEMKYILADIKKY